jgi:hypothetical protein
MNRWLLCLGLVTAAGGAATADPAAVERGREAVRGRPALNPPVGTTAAYDNLWKQWGAAEKPADYPRAVRDRYGLHPAPYENAGLPMGLHPARGLLMGKGVGTDCLLCHAGTVAGRTVIGLANSTMDVDGLIRDLFAASGMRIDVPFRAAYVRGTIDPITPAAFLVAARDADLNLRPPQPLDITPGLCSDPPAWWLLKKKKTRDWTGAIDARSTRIDMVTILSPFNSASFVKQQAGVFADIHEFVIRSEPPKYPFPVDPKLAAAGKEVYADTCAKCHGTPGPAGKYPNKIVPVDEIGTDPLLALSFSHKHLDHANATWLTAELGPDGKPYKVADTRGYQAPPLDGVWATAPYFHNGSVPTLYHVLNSTARPKIFTRSYGCEPADYDREKLGLKVTTLDAPPGEAASGHEQRKVYDTTIPGRRNTGHTYGDDLTDAERTALIEYLKTI